MAGNGRKVWAADEILAAADLQDYIQDQVVFVYDSASARSSGILAPTEGMVSYLKDTNLLYAFDGSSWVEIAPNVGTPGTYTKVTTDAKGRVSSGTTLSAGDIPTIDINSQTSGTLAAARIANLDMSKVTSGNLDYTRVVVGAQTITAWVDSNFAYKTIDASAVTSGTLNIDRIPTIPSSKLGTGNWNMGASTLTTTNVTASGVVTAGDFTAGNGTLTANGAIVSTSIYNNSLSGPYRAVWVNSSGLLGNTASTMRVKQDIVDADLSADAARQLRLRNFRYIADVENDADAPTYVGLIAEELLEIPGMEKFVFFDELEDGSKVPAGIHYEWLALALIPLVQELSDRFDGLEARVSELEK